MSMNEKRIAVVQRLETLKGKWDWANREVSDTAREAIDLIAYMDQRIHDLERMVLTREMLAREFYNGEG
jgi:hypothetical protein